VFSTNFRDSQNSQIYHLGGLTNVSLLSIVIVVQTVNMSKECTILNNLNSEYMPKIDKISTVLLTFKSKPIYIFQFRLTPLSSVTNNALWAILSCPTISNFCHVPLTFVAHGLLHIAKEGKHDFHRNVVDPNTCSGPLFISKICLKQNCAAL